jgi:hypothetical protein
VSADGVVVDAFESGGIGEAREQSRYGDALTTLSA